MLKRALILTILLWPLSVLAQSSSGEIDLAIVDPAGNPVRTTVELTSQPNVYHHLFTSDEGGVIEARRLPPGTYQLRIQANGFAPLTDSIDLHNSIPFGLTLHLSLAPVSASVDVAATSPLVDPHRAGSSNQIGQQTIDNRLTALPGRSLQELVNTQPGWLYEGNAVLHPRGSEYQTQIVVDGIPLTDNRSPGFGPELEAADLASLTIYTAAIPVEYGRKMGGVVAVTTRKDDDPGLHGQATLFGGSYATAGISTHDQYTWKRNSLGFSASGSETDHYLNPVVPENYTNHGTTADFASNYERDLNADDRLTLNVRHELARYAIPNELVQQQGAYVPDASNNSGCPAADSSGAPGDCVFVSGGQLQTSDNFETIGSVSYQHIFSPNALGTLHAMSRDNSSDFHSNPASWPLIAAQHNSFRELYFNAAISLHHGRQEFKAGIQSDATFLHEDFHYQIPDCASLSDPRCPITLGILDAGATTFAFTGSRPDLEQSAWLEDNVRAGHWSIAAGLRWDHYQLLVNQNAVSPRLALARYFPRTGISVHASYDRVFQTPSFENILLSSSPSAQALDTSVAALQLPVEPSHGNYYEVGATTAFLTRLRLDANFFRRDVNNYADDSQILSTGISFPIAFRKAVLYGAEGKLELPHTKHVSGFASYSYIVGNVWNPVTGGLFLGGDANSPTGHFPDSQDQRNSLRARIRYQAVARLSFSLGTDYNSGLPFEPDQTPQQYATEYGQIVVKYLDFARNRIHPYLTESTSVAADLYQRDKASVRIQADIQNLSNTLELIDFGGLFSGNAVGPARQYTFRLATNF